MKRVITLPAVLMGTGFVSTAAVIWFVDSVSSLVYAPGSSELLRFPELPWLVYATVYSAVFWVPLVAVVVAVVHPLTRHLNSLNAGFRAFVISSLVFGLPAGSYTWHLTRSLTWALTAASILGLWYGVFAGAVAVWSKTRPSAAVS